MLAEGQRRVLDEARRRVGNESLIPPERSYSRQLKTYERQVRDAGMKRMHGAATLRERGGLEGACGQGLARHQA